MGYSEQSSTNHSTANPRAPERSDHGAALVWRLANGWHKFINGRLRARRDRMARTVPLKLSITLTDGAGSAQRHCPVFRPPCPTPWSCPQSVRRWSSTTCWNEGASAELRRSSPRAASGDGAFRAAGIACTTNSARRSSPGPRSVLANWRRSAVRGARRSPMRATEHAPLFPGASEGMHPRARCSRWLRACSVIGQAASGGDRPSSCPPPFRLHRGKCDIVGLRPTNSARHAMVLAREVAEGAHIAPSRRCRSEDRLRAEGLYTHDSRHAR